MIVEYGSMDGLSTSEKSDVDNETAARNLHFMASNEQTKEETNATIVIKNTSMIFSGRSNVRDSVSLSKRITHVLPKMVILV